MTTADTMFYASLACIAITLVTFLVGGIAEYRRRLMFALAAAGFAGYVVLGGLSADMIEDDFETNVVAAVEAKYDVEVTQSSRGGGPEDLRTWTIDEVDRECYLDGLPSPTDFRGYTDPVLRCAADTDLPELGSDD